jgi:hypothetical protein
MYRTTVHRVFRCFPCVKRAVYGGWYVLSFSKSMWVTSQRSSEVASVTGWRLIRRMERESSRVWYTDGVKDRVFML